MAHLAWLDRLDTSSISRMLHTSLDQPVERRQSAGYYKQRGEVAISRQQQRGGKEKSAARVSREASASTFYMCVCVARTGYQGVSYTGKSQRHDFHSAMAADKSCVYLSTALKMTLPTFVNLVKSMLSTLSIIIVTIVIIRQLCNAEHSWPIFNLHLTPRNPIPALLSSSQKPSHGNISVTKRGIIDPLVSKQP